MFKSLSRRMTTSSRKQHRSNSTGPDDDEDPGGGEPITGSQSSSWKHALSSSHSQSRSLSHSQSWASFHAAPMPVTASHLSHRAAAAEISRHAASASTSAPAQALVSPPPPPMLTSSSRSHGPSTGASPPSRDNANMSHNWSGPHQQHQPISPIRLENGFAGSNYSLPSGASTHNTDFTNSYHPPPSLSSAPGLPMMVSNGHAPEAQPAEVRTFDIDDLISRLIEAGYQSPVKMPKLALKNHEIVAVCQAAREIFLSQPTLIELNPPVKIVGDTHGQYQDLLRMFNMCGWPPQANYLFMGDYVDRGKQSLETILLLLCYKIKFPENFFLLRGNHECANVTRVYGFYDECKRRSNIKIWRTFVDVFNTLPIAAVVATKIFCVHGGLSPSLASMDDIRQIERPTDVPDYGLLNDLLWSDPSELAFDWEDNERGVSHCFGKTVIAQFLAQNDFDLLARAHMVVEDGYEFWNDRTLVTIFSAPNYCGEFDNFGAVMSVSSDLLCAFELLKPLDAQALKKEMAEKPRLK